MSWKGSLE
jgi:hypothetical protein